MSSTVSPAGGSTGMLERAGGDDDETVGVRKVLGETQATPGAPPSGPLTRADSYELVAIVRPSPRRRMSGRSADAERRPDRRQDVLWSPQHVGGGEPEDGPAGQHEPVLPPEVLHEHPPLAVHVAVELDQHAPIGPRQ